MIVLTSDDLFPAKTKRNKYFGKTIGEIMDEVENPKSWAKWFNTHFDRNMCLSDDVFKERTYRGMTPGYMKHCMLRTPTNNPAYS